MAFDFTEKHLEPAVLPDEFRWVAWHPALCDVHGLVKYRSFHGEMDSVVFPTFTRFDACVRLMRSIAASPSFIPKATWLIARGAEINIRRPEQGKTDFCATIQGLRSDAATGAIQNVAVCPEFRQIGLGRALVLQALEGFRQSGCRRVTLEATAENFPAIHLYRQIGFEVTQTVYKETFMNR